MKKPDASHHNPDPHYIAGLIDQTGLTQEEVARRLGITPKALRNYKSETMAREIPYATQFALECLASQDS